MDNPQCISSEFFLIFSIGQMKWYQTKSSIYNARRFDESVNLLMLVASQNGHIILEKNHSNRRIFSFQNCVIVFLY